MKTLILKLAFAMTPVFCFAQSNNPYNQRGLDYITSVNIISGDFNAGKVKGFTEETIRNYTKIIPLQTQVTMDMVSMIVKSSKGPNYNLEAALKSSSLSSFGKQLYRDLVNPKKLSLKEFNNVLANKVDEVNKSKLAPAEKEFLLSMIAITYHGLAANPVAKNAECYIETEQGSGTIPCPLAGALVGAAFGFSICGPWCALGGAVVGAILGSLS